MKVFKQGKIVYAKCVEFDDDFDESELHVAELQARPPYICTYLKPVKGKEKLNSISHKSYSFDITKVDQIFDIELKDKQII